MRVRLLVASAIVFIVSPSDIASAYAAPTTPVCLDPANQWTCFGALELKTANAARDTTARMYRYTNGELLFEIDTATGTQRALLLPSAGIEIFQGLASNADLEVNRNPFAFAGEGFMAIPTLLQQAFPAGPGVVTSAPQETDTILKGNASAHVTVERVDAGTVSYQIVLSDRQFSGRLNQNLLPPLPDKSSLKDWLSKAGKFRTLHQARAYKAPKAKKE